MTSGIGFRHFALADPGRIAVIEADGSRWTREELFGLSNQISRALRNAGMRKGDVLALIAPNCAEYLAVYLATMQAGLYFVPVNWHLTAAEIVHVVSSSGAKALVVHRRHAGPILANLQEHECLPPLRVALGGEARDCVSLRELVDGVSTAPLDDELVGRAMVFTSATTGMPKAIRRSLDDAPVALERLLRLTESLNAAAGVLPDGGGTHLCQSMLYHVAPLDCSFAALNLGHQVVLMERWTPEEALRLIEAHRIAVSVMVPAMFVRLLKLPASLRDRYSVASLRFVSHGGAPCPVEVKRQMIEWWGPILVELYGASEGGGTSITSTDWLRYPGTVGRAHPGSEIRILDDELREVPCGTVGTIYMRPFTLDRFEYLGDPEKTRAAYWGDFFTAGDLGYLNEEGYLFIADRRTDMIIAGGVNVYSAEIERVLVTHESVLDCAVFGVPDSLLGQRVVAVVEPMAGVPTGPDLTQDLLAFLSARLAAYKVPKLIAYTDKLPRDPAGKLFKRRIRDDYLAERVSCGTAV